MYARTLTCGLSVSMKIAPIRNGALLASLFACAQAFPSYIACDLAIKKGGALGESVVTTSSNIMFSAPVDDSALATASTTTFSSGSSVTISFSSDFLRGFVHSSAGAFTASEFEDANDDSSAIAVGADLTASPCTGTNSIQWKMLGTVTEPITWTAPNDVNLLNDVTLSFGGAPGFGAIRRTEILLTKAATPTEAPTTASPTGSPTISATISPTVAPTRNTDSPTEQPTQLPSSSPTGLPVSFAPTSAPTDLPTVAPTVPTPVPSSTLAQASPTPTVALTSAPSAPINAATSVPTSAPTNVPSVTSSDTDVDTDSDANESTVAPTAVPSLSPTSAPTSELDDSAEPAQPAAEAAQPDEPAQPPPPAGGRGIKAAIASIGNGIRRMGAFAFFIVVSTIAVVSAILIVISVLVAPRCRSRNQSAAP